MEQGVRYVVNIEDGGSVSNLTLWERDANNLESSIGSLNNSFRNLGLTISMVFAAREIYEFGKSIVETSAKLESFRNLINFSSRDLYEAQRNQAEVMKVVTDYKLPIMETYDQYGKFMAAIKGTPIEGDKARKSFDDIALTLGVMHLPAERAARAMYAIQEMMSEGRVQTRHFLRQLAPAVPGIDEAAAHVLHTDIQHFIKRLAANPKSGQQLNAYDFLPKVFAEMRAEMQDKLPVAMQSLQANIIDLSNKWIELKDDIGEKLKPEIISLFNELKALMSWVKTHEDDIIKWGKTIAELAKYYLEWKAASLAVKLAEEGIIGIKNTYLWLLGKEIENTTSQTTALGGQKIAVDELAASIERLNYVSNAQNGSFITNAAGVTMANTIGNRYASVMESDAISGFLGGAETAENAVTRQNINRMVGGGALGVASRLGGMSSAALPVAIVAMSAGILQELRGYMAFDKEYSNANDQRRFELDKQRALEQIKDINSVKNSVLNFLGFGHYNASMLQGKGTYENYGLGDLVKQHPEILQDQSYVNEVRRLLDVKGDQNLILLAKQLGFVREDEQGVGYANKILGTGGQWNDALLKKYGVKGPGAPINTGGGNTGHNADKITGQTIKHVTVNIKEINGIRELHTATAGENIHSVAKSVERALLAVANDSEMEAA